MKNMLMAVLVAAIGSAQGGKVLNYPVYTVTVPPAVSNSLASLSAGCTFTKTAASGEEPEATSSADFLAETAAGTLVKRGEGWLVIEEPIADWTGQIHVEEGVLRAACSNALGKVMVSATSSVSYPTDADGTYVSSGATLFMDASFCSTGPTREKKTIVFEGTGAPGLNGALVAYGRGLKDNTAWPLGANPRLSGDATIYIDINRKSANVAAGCPRLSLNQKAYPRIVLDLAEHVLTLKGRVDEGYNDPIGSDLNFNQGVISNGHIVVENVIFHEQNAPQLIGGSEYTLHMKPQSILAFESLWPPVTNNWTLLYESANVWKTYHSNKTSTGYELGHTNYYCWNGPVELRAPIRTAPGTAGFYGLALNGPVSGNYGIHAHGGNSTNSTALHLSSPNNTFTGGVGLYRARLFAYHSGALPAAGAMLAATNSEVYFPAVENYELPAAEFVKTGLVHSAINGTISGAWNTALVKKGAGELFYDSTFDAPLLDVQGGGVKLHCAQPGLIYGILPGSNSSRGATVEMESNVIPTNSVALGTDVYYASRPKFTCYIYSGYIWNREATNVTWTFASTLLNGSRLLIDGTQLFSRNISNTRRGIVASIDNIAPGPHSFVVRSFTPVGTSASSYTSGGSNGLTNMTWNVANRGFMWDPHGRNSTNIVDYIQAYDPGDGSVFTVTTNGVLPETLSLRPNFPQMRFAAGTYLDANGADVATGDLMGAPMVTNSSAFFQDFTFSVTNSWTVPAADLAAGAVLDVHGKLAFGPDVALSITDFAELPHVESRVIARAAAIEGMPAFTPNVAHPARWRFRKTPDGRELRLDYACGLKMIIR